MAGTTSVGTPDNIKKVKIQLQGRSSEQTEIRLTEFLNEVLDTGGSDGVVVPLPVEDVGKVASGGEGLDNHLGLEVGDLSDLLVLGKVGVLLDDDDTLTEEVGEDRSLFLLADKNHNNLCVYSIITSTLKNTLLFHCPRLHYYSGHIH